MCKRQRHRSEPETKVGVEREGAKSQCVFLYFILFVKEKQNEWCVWDPTTHKTEFFGGGHQIKPNGT